MSNVPDFPTFVRQVNKTRAPVNLLRKIRENIVPSSYPLAIQWIRNNDVYRNLIFNDYYPTSIAKVNNAPLLSSVHINKELKWAIAYLTPHSIRIKEFLLLANEYSHLLMSGNNSSAEAVLDKIESIFGSSLWLCRRKIAHYSFNHGPDAAKKYLQSQVAELGEASGVIKYILICANRRLDSTVRVKRFLELEASTFDSAELPEDLLAYLRYNVNPTGEFSDTDVAFTLKWEMASSIIDYYEALIWAVQQISLNGNNSNKKTLQDVLKSLYENIGDERLELTYFREGKTINYCTKELVDTVNIFNSMIEGDYLTASQLSSSALDEYPDNIDIRELYVKSLLFQNNGPFSSEGELFNTKINKLIAAVIAKNLDLEVAADELARIAYAFYPCSWAKGILNFLQRELILSSPVQVNKITASTSSSLKPISPLRLSSYINSVELQRYLLAFNEAFPNSSASTYLKQVTIDNIDYLNNIDQKSDDFKFLLASLAVQRGHWHDAIKIGRLLNQSPIVYYKQLSWPILASSYARLSNFFECVETVTSAFVETPSLVSLLPAKDAVHAVECMQKNDLVGNISVPIIYNILVDNHDKSYMLDRSNAYEDFLDSLGIQRASRLIPDAIPLDRQKLIYFLRHLAIAPVIEPTAVFRNSDEILNERLTICQQLLEFDAERLDIYTSEIEDITQRSMIKRRMREVEQSKIYIDVDGIKQSIDPHIHEAFNRYISFLRSDVSSDTNDIVNEFKLKVQLRDIESLIKLILPRNEMNNLLRLMVLYFRDSFVSKSEYGLSGYLSTNIRHGTLFNHLRAPVGSANLVTELDSTTGEYKTNNMLLTSITNPVARAKVDVLLKNFSRDFDQQVTIINDEWIQIDTDGTTPGLLRFALAETDLVPLASSISEDTTFNQFVDIVLDVMHHLLKITLGSARKYLNTVGKESFYALLSALEFSLDSLDLGSEVGDIKNAIASSRTGISDAMNRVIGWFNHSSDLAQDPFEVEVAIRIATKGLHAAMIPFNFQIHRENRIPISFDGKLLPSMVAIFSTLFQNIVKDTKKDYIPNAEIYIRQQRNKLHIVVENNLHPSVNHSDLENRLDNLKADIQQKEHTKALSTEGGTGLIKVRKILRHDLKLVDALFDFRLSDNKFVVEIGLDLTR